VYAGGVDPFPGYSARRCAEEPACYIARRDASLNVEEEAFRQLIREAVSQVVL
jgi:hypothetical protein